MRKRTPQPCLASRWAALLAAILAACGKAEETPTLEGEITIETMAELEELDGIERIEGSLRLSAGLKGQVELSDLVSVRDELFVEGTTIESLSLPSLERVGGFGVEDNPKLTTVELPALTEVVPASPDQRGFFGLGHNQSLERVLVPKLHVVQGAVQVFGDKLASVSFPALERAEGVEVQAEALRQLNLAALNRVESLEFRGNRGIRSVVLPRLRTVEGMLVLSSEALESFEAPELDFVSWLYVLSKQRLTSLELPSLRDVDELSMCTKGLPSLSLPALEYATKLSIGSCDEGVLKRVDLPTLAWVDRLDVSGPSLVELDLSRLFDVASLGINSTNLETLRLPALSRASFVQLFWNPRLRQLEVPALQELGGADVRGNGSDLPCELEELFPSVNEPSAVIFQGACL